MIRWCFLGIHTWNQWEQYDWTGMITMLCYGVPLPSTKTSEHRQRRKCSLCGKEQDELVRQG